MTNDELLTSWERTRGHLVRAWVELPPGEINGTYQEFLDHNELELAMETLADAGAERAAPATFWSALADAADEMRLSDQAGSYRRRFDDYD
jgi:hypothetical protein